MSMPHRLITSHFDDANRETDDVENALAFSQVVSDFMLEEFLLFRSLILSDERLRRWFPTEKKPREFIDVRFYKRAFSKENQQHLSSLVSRGFLEYTVNKDKKYKGVDGFDYLEPYYTIVPRALENYHFGRVHPTFKEPAIFTLSLRVLASGGSGVSERTEYYRARSLTDAYSQCAEEFGEKFVLPNFWATVCLVDVKCSLYTIC